MRGLFPSDPGPPSSPDGVEGKLRRYVDQIVDWNSKISNIISHNDGIKIVSRHIAESLAPARWMAETKVSRCIDIGSGAGFPAIPLAIAGVGETWTLVESRRMKTLFLRKSAAEIELKSVEIIVGRIELLVDSLGQFDCFTSRATLPAIPSLQVAQGLVVPGGSAFLWKGSGFEDEIKDRAAWEQSWTLDRVMSVGPTGAIVCRFIRNR